MQQTRATNARLFIQFSGLSEVVSNNIQHVLAHDALHPRPKRILNDDKKSDHCGNDSYSRQPARMIAHDSFPLPARPAFSVA
ncbi:hypothetical protein B7760_05870 (plasmid) [Burkholderia glumae]|nr:hypothetical protein B7760_05870 [Burkholderia glumae]